MGMWPGDDYFASRYDYLTEYVQVLRDLWGTGRSDFPNQINNVMVFPGIFKGALAVRAREITEGMKIRAARALAALVTDEQLSADYILPSALDKSVADTVARAVAQEAREQGIARA